MSLDTECLCGTIPHVEIGPHGSALAVLSGGQAFMRRPSPERLRRDAVRLRRLMPKGRGFTLFGYGPRHYAEAGLDGLADSFAAILSCRSGPVQLVGVSYGGLVATRIAARHPSLVSDLILLASAASFSEEGRARLQRQIQLAGQGRYAELLSDFGGTFRRPWYNWVLRARLRLRHARLAEEMNAPDEILAYLEAAEGAEETDAHASLSRITARALVIGGARDQVFGQRLADTASAIPHARLHLLPDETHMAPVERAADFRREMTAFLADSGSTMSAKNPPTAGREKSLVRKGTADV
ncbi:alpha/beta hydrolase [Silicimonas algicola]|uniref:Pimeloyl-ACP methyl ester carboxylesterase n=1 Tax=Silicimonas algicola TaxID=1826607 RepID=A0A316FTS3_9RHOB|nr:alpha/beta hydrolase [Silicimonas algicola]AZQ67629.1 alpha/beta hydrolase [Silicimonas algicola]PWK51662.1 pimeloyl-ACP methyl ester carboxylesterase [Silicimonas algicola]